VHRRGHHGLHDHGERRGAGLVFGAVLGLGLGHKNVTTITFMPK
jgi:hypothetical protein